MKNTFFILAFILINLNSVAQLKDIIGMYVGNYTTDMAIINITLELKNDNTFLLTQKNNFTEPRGCQNSTVLQKGDWAYKKGWIYFKPDTIYNRDGISLYINFKEDNKNKKLLKNMNQKGYNTYLKPFFEDKLTTKIYFHIADDCYESYWDYKCITKIN